MSEGQQSEHEAEPNRPSSGGDGAPAPETRSGVGTRLRRAREAQGRSARAVASSLNLPLVTIEALERGDRDGLPPTTFVRGYLRNYAQLVGLDPEEVAAAYERAVRAERPGPERPAGRRGATLGAPGPRAWLIAASALAVLALAVSVIVGVLVGGGDAPEPGKDTASTADQVPEVPRESSPSGSAGGEAEAPDGGSAAASDAAEVAAQQAGAMLGPRPGGVEALLAAELRLEEGEAIPDAPPAAEDGPDLVLRIREGQSWVSVEGDGERLAYGTLEGPLTREFDGAEAYRLVIGNAAQAEVVYRGEPVDLAPHTDGRVARLELSSESE